MKNWLTIGQFAEISGLSAKTLRHYEEVGLIPSHSRGENDYRYYRPEQLDLALRVKDFKALGFSLAEIKALLKIDPELQSEDLTKALQARRSLIENQTQQLQAQKNMIEDILSSLAKKSEPLKAQQRRAIMGLYGNISIVVTGVEGLRKSADYIQKHFAAAGKTAPIIEWSANSNLPEEKPYVLIVKESDLGNEKIKELNPDVILIKNFSEHSGEIESRYLNVFAEVGPHVTTVFNADDRASVAFAANSEVKKGRIFYYSKNKALEKQIRQIGGVLSDGEELAIFGFNLKPEVLNLKLSKIRALEDEIALLSSLGAVMTAGLEKSELHR